MINKNQNINLQLTINKNDYKKLIEIVNYLSLEKETTFTKSQTITILINNFYKQIEKNNKESRETIIKKNGEKTELLTYSEQAKYIKPIKELKKIYNHNELKNKYGLSAPMISALINKEKTISRNYEKRIIKALKDNNIEF